jgi:hypothetical protein
MAEGEGGVQPMVRSGGHQVSPDWWICKCAYNSVYALFMLARADNIIKGSIMQIFSHFGFGWSSNKIEA